MPPCRIVTLAALLALLALRVPAAAAEESSEVRRRVLALHDSRGRNYELDTEDPVHQLLELPLNHLGMVVRRHDIRSGPPPEEWLAGTRAILTFFDATDDPPDWLWPWLESRGTRPGMRIIHLGEFGPLAYARGGDRENTTRLAAWLRRFGLQLKPGFLPGPVGIRIEARDPARMSLESNPRRFAVHRGPRNTDERNVVWLQTCPADNEADKRHPVVTGPWGGIALAPWTARGGGEKDARRWHLDPFAFFRAALGLERVPAPHPSMLNGRRMFVLHVDGDGFESLSTVRPGQFAAAVFLDEVIRKFDLPMTISVIVAGLTDDYTPDEPTEKMKLAREIFSQPNVESGSHSILHPLRWDLGTSWYKELKHYEYDPVEEARGSIRFINRWLTPEDRPCRMMLWSGVANPSRDAIASLASVGAGNINGGVFRWDTLTKSVGYVSPWGNLKGDALQVYVGATNENDFLGFFTTMPGAFGHIEETIRRTGSPRVLKPANVYCHFYSAEHPVRLSTLQKLVQRWGVEQETAPVFASTYSRAVRSAVFGARILRRADGWILKDFGDCRTVRIDNEPLQVDFAASRGLIGSRRIGDSLYIHLAGPEAVVVLARHPAPHAHVEQANHALSAVTLAPLSISFTSKAIGKRVVVLAGFPPKTSIRLHIDERSETLETDDSGRLRIGLPPGGPTRIRAITEQR